MNIILRRNLLLMISSLILFPAIEAQVKRVNSCNPMSKTQASYTEAYDYDYVDEQPQFPGGDCALVNFINQTREYPYEAYKNKIEGRVLCSFIINPDGSVSNISVVRGVNELLNREAMRVISEMPKWHAGKMGGSTVPVRCYLPIAFRL